jgi:hypothetical protein
MIEVKERYVIDEAGTAVAVLLDIADYRKLLEMLEELDARRVYDEAKASSDRLIPLEEAIRELESRHQ